MPRKGIGRVWDRYEIDTQIVKTIAFNPDATIDAIAKATGLSYTAVKNSLQRLVILGVVEETYAAEGANRRGRPSTFFRIDKGLQILIPPRQFHHLAQILIEQLVQERGTKEVSHLLNRAAKLQADKLMSAWESEKSTPSSLVEVIDRLCDYINQQGCYATHSTMKTGYYIQVNNCVYDDIAGRFPGTICSYHSTLITYCITTFDDSVSITHEQSIASGDPHCRYVIVRQ